MKELFDDFDEEPQIDLTPLIDCLFMLIIFFVLTMSFSKPVLDIVLPKAENAAPATRRDELLLSVKADGSYWVDNKAVTLADVAAMLDAQPERLLNIFMDEKAPFSRFVDVVDMAKVKREGRFVISTDARPRAAAGGAP